MKIIAKIYTDFPEKFGIPRQSGLIEELEGRIVFEKEYRNKDAVRGLEDFSHIWLLWEFSKAVRDGWSATVRPPLLGGNTRMGVFATRSPFRPNSIGLSCLKLKRIEYTEEDGPVIYVSGVDMMSGTPVYDIKPYLPYADCRPDATGGFTDELPKRELAVNMPEELLEKVSKDKREALLKVLATDPRPSYQNSPERLYGMSFAGYEVGFTVDKDILTVENIEIIESNID
ncbi:MAG: tRNA (N6-threonylcarbamoyladenosine(37)-N6)-methyltransferase TrmO [Lachnospiraceae bacterium]|nr:tRNA (N6-threonylcarbamoyladenosine(37)-N6)-methyltransferase TrmO [Lachnospiraceae bacterium]